MFGILIYDILLFAIPIVMLVFFGVSLYRYLTAKKKNEATPGTFSDEEIKRRKKILTIASVIVGVLVAIVIGFTILMFMAVAYM